MHDWTLISILVNWIDGTAVVSFRNQKSEEVRLIAEGLVDLHIPKREEWGSSVSINEVVGPVHCADGNYSIELEVQSGDRIKLMAKTIAMP